jgi:hypothetical protein
VDVQEITNVLLKLKSKAGEIIPYQRTNTLIITDYGHVQRRFTELLKSLDVPGGEDRVWVYDVDGNLLTSNFADYLILSAPEVPSFETTHYETPSPNNPLGAKGIGESGAIGSTAAVQNAVIDAIRHLGVKHLDMPMTPQKVWAAIANASAPTPTKAPSS